MYCDDSVLQISTMTILNMDDNSATMAEDEMFTSRQGARHVCVALKKYFEAHLAIKADQIRRSHLRNEGGSPLAEIPAYKVINNYVSTLYYVTKFYAMYFVLKPGQ